MQETHLQLMLLVESTMLPVRIWSKFVLAGVKRGYIVEETRQARVSRLLIWMQE